MAFVLFEEITCFQLCALCACERDGSRAYFAHTTSNHATALIQKMKLDKGAFLQGEFREPNRKDKVTRFHSASYAR